MLTLLTRDEFDSFDWFDWSVFFLICRWIYSHQLAFAFFPRKCVESCGALAKVTAVSPTVFPQLRERFARRAASTGG